MVRFWLGFAICLGSVPAASVLAKENALKITSKVWGTTSEGQEVQLFTLTNSHGHTVDLTNWGATIVAVRVPDRDGERANVTLGFPSLEGYLQRHPFFGSTVGRFCNRIAGGRFELDGQEYTLVQNNNGNHLHGGTVGFDAQLWSAEPMELVDRVGVRFQLISPDGQEGYPGRLEVIAEYTWDDENQLAYAFTATTDRPTVVNLTNHAYWNLAGAGNRSIVDHVLAVEADQFLEVDETLIPTGKLLQAADTPFDFLNPRRIGDAIDQLEATKGYDHCYVVRGKKGSLRPAARVVEPDSGRTMDVWTTQPGMQFYTGNHLPGDDSSAGFGQHAGFCLETQHYPDAPNKHEFLSTRLNPDQTLSETTVHRFGVDGVE
jgi:aldose 1-epimerase